MGSNRSSLPTVSAEIRDRFNLGFLRNQNGSEFSLPKTFLHYNPACVGGDPFSGAEQRNSAAVGGSLISQREYFSQFGLKGIPSVKQPIIPTGASALDPVPEIPESATGRRRTRLERERAGIVRSNGRKATRLDLISSRLDSEKALYRDATPPEECPPSRYEGTTPRQPGDPLPEQRRISPSAAMAAYRPRGGTSGENS